MSVGGGGGWRGGRKGERKEGLMVNQHLCNVLKVYHAYLTL